jgi:hypothetical protein
MDQACSTHGKENNFIKKYILGGTSDAQARLFTKE